MEANPKEALNGCTPIQFQTKFWTTTCTPKLALCMDGEDATPYLDVRSKDGKDLWLVIPNIVDGYSVAFYSLYNCGTNMWLGHSTTELMYTSRRSEVLKNIGYCWEFKQHTSNSEWLIKAAGLDLALNLPSNQCKGGTKISLLKSDGTGTPDQRWLMDSTIL